MAVPLAHSRTNAVRYVFDTPAQARLHFHPRGGSLLLFIHDPHQTLTEGLPVSLEVAFSSSDQRIALRGFVQARESGPLAGAWLDCPGTQALEGLLAALSRPRRRHYRVLTDRMVTLRNEAGAASVGRLVDVSIAGARIAGVTGAFVQGDRVLLGVLAGGELPVAARVLRARGGEIAVELPRHDLASRRLGERLVEEAQRFWSRAMEVRHPAACRCTSGRGVLEPLLPRTAHRNVEEERA